MPEIAELEAMRKELSARIGRAKRDGRDADDLIRRHREIGMKIEHLQTADQGGENLPDELVVETIADPERFAGLREDWSGLVSRSSCSSPFLLWEWLWPWWSVYGGKRELVLMVARKGQRLLGVAPMMRGLRRRGKVDHSVLGFLGTGERAEGDYFGLVVDRDEEQEARRALWEAAWDLADEESLELHLEHLAIEDREAAALVQVMAAHGAHVIVRPGRRSVRGRLPATFEEFLEMVPSKNRRYYLRYQRNRLEDEVGETDHFVAEDDEGLQRVLDAMERFSCARLAGADQDSAWADPQFVECMHGACALMLEKGRVRAETLELQEQPIAALVGFVHQHTYFCYQMAFDPNYADYMPGHCLLESCIRWCIDEGLTGFDFLAGEHQYKRSYFAGRRRLADVAVIPPTPRSLWRTGMRYVADACKSRAKRMLGRAQ